MQEANAAFLAEFGKYFTIKRVSRNKLHPEYRNEMVEIIKAKRISTGGKQSMKQEC